MVDKVCYNYETEHILGREVSDLLNNPEESALNCSIEKPRSSSMTEIESKYWDIPVRGRDRFNTWNAPQPRPILKSVNSSFSESTEPFISTPETSEKHVRFKFETKENDASLQSNEWKRGLGISSGNVFTEDEDKVGSVTESISILDVSDENVFPEEKPTRNASNFYGFSGLPPFANHRLSQATEIVNSLMPALRNGYNNNYNTRMASKIVNCSAVIFSDPIWSTELVPQTIEYANDHATQLFRQFRNVARRVEASYTWSGHLPKRSRNKNPIYSCKVFLGGIPYDLTDSDLHMTFAKFGHISIQWPGKDVKSAIDGAAENKAGYVYIIFESYDNVAALLNACNVSYKDVESGCRWYYTISSRRVRMKEVQVIPFDIGDRFYMKNSFTGQMEHAKTVFVGALHGMLTADGLAKVMDDLFGGVIFAGLDTDKHKYPLGSGRVSFDNNDSYSKAIYAAFIEIKSQRFKKRIQIDPYIENESTCCNCKQHQLYAIFCRDMKCLKYYCVNCWEIKHSDADTRNHRPIIKNKSPV